VNVPGELPPDVDAGRLLRLADAWAEQLEVHARPVQFRAAASPGELEAILRLRYRTVIDHGWARPEQFPDGLERDAFDDRALHIGGWADDALAACARLVFPEQGLRLPTEDAFDLVIPHGAVDVGRGVVASACRDSSHRVLTGLLARCWRELRSRGFSQMCGDAAPWLLDVYRDMGFEVEPLGPARRHWGEERIPFRVDGVASVLHVLDGAGGRRRPRPSR
jgi:predicted GNAT family N-acyltransferase